MKVTRRALARLAAAASAAGTIPSKARAQPPAPAAANGAAPSPTALQLAQVKLPRATEPATRFEA